MKRKGITKKIMKAELFDNRFIRVTNLNDLNEPINISLYKEITTTTGTIDYKKVFPDELPMNLVNKLSIDSNYKKVSQEEAETFLNRIKEVQSVVEDNNAFTPQEFLKVDTVCDTTYLLAKEKQCNYYCLNALRINEFGVASGQVSISPFELPYILMDILEKNDFKEITILVFLNHFVRVVKEEDKYLCIIYQYVDNPEKPSVKTLDIYTIVENEEEFVLIKDIESDLSIEINEEKIKRYSADFLETIDLKILE